MPESNSAAHPPTARLVAAFAAVYIIWGSTYLAIRYAVGTIPPFLMAGSRFLCAGAILYIWARLKGAERPGPMHWRSTGIVGALLLLCGNGGVVWAEQRVPSALTALLIGTVPLWMTLLDWVAFNRIRPTRSTLIGVVLGFAGIALLIDPTNLRQSADLIGELTIVAAAVAWAAGSLYARRATFPDSPLLATAMEMLAGGALQIVAGTLLGEWSRLDISAISTESVIALLYLIIFGALIAFTAYVWLLRVTTPAYVATYAYVNPVVAVVLGWAIAGEEITVRTMAAAGIIVVAVVIITSFRPRAIARKSSLSSLTKKKRGQGG
jgi:drug/metabolite transporter (DMT)-like permease